MVTNLRPYQEHALSEILDYAIENPTGRLLVVMAPRSGKTPTMAAAMRLMTIEQGLRGLWVVERVEILDAARKHLIDCGFPEDSVGIIYQDRPQNLDRPFQVASAATLDQRTKPEAQAVAWDEAHHDGAPRRQRLRALYPQAFHLGSTGTPHLLNGKRLGRDYDRMIVPVQTSELIHDGYLSVPRVYAPEDHYLPKMCGVRVRGGDYAPDALEKLVGHASTIDKLVEEWERLAERRATIVYAVTVRHSQHIAEAFRRRGITAQHLDGETPNAERLAMLQDLREGRIQVVCSVGILSEGVDLPEVKCCMLARPTRSLALYIQQGARCMTPWNNIQPVILDCVGNSYRHGAVYEDRAWSLQRESSEKNSQGPRARRCIMKGCGGVSPISARVCAVCGASFKASKAAAQLAIVEAKRLVEICWSSDQIAKQRVRLEAFASERGFSPGWAERALAKMISGPAHRNVEASAT